MPETDGYQQQMLVTLTGNYVTPTLDAETDKWKAVSHYIFHDIFCLISLIQAIPNLKVYSICVSEKENNYSYRLGLFFKVLGHKVMTFFQAF